MKIHELFPSTYLKAIDLDGAPLRVTIEKLALENVSREDPNEFKPVLHFVGIDRGLVLNITNGKSIAELNSDRLPIGFHSAIPGPYTWAFAPSRPAAISASTSSWLYGPCCLPSMDTCQTFSAVILAPPPCRFRLSVSS